MKDNIIFELIQKEEERQRNNVELIASENYCSEEVREAVGSILTNKYAEGYPNARYYGGCVNVDQIEELARERAKELFGCDHANVQPHSGSSANMAVYRALLKTGDRILGMSLDAGGHLTHGYKLSFSGKDYEAYNYGVDKETERLDYDEIRKIALEVKPQMIVCGASAYTRFIDYERFREIADEAGAYLMVDMAHVAGLVAAGLHPSPVPYADVVTSTTHKTLRGPRGGLILCKEEFAKQIDKAVFPGIQGGPLCHVIAGKAVCFYEALQPEFIEYQKQVIANAKALADGLKEEGFRLISGGTDNHMVLVDVKHPMGVTGKMVEEALDKVHITVNKNSIPYDEEKPAYTSGIRIGTPAMTTRGFKETEFRKVAEWISRIAYNIDCETTRNEVAQEVREVMDRINRSC
ncbi:MAG: serine hydroxymethyltransferase [Erysipelotrichaceae bacterium]|nr:serine hydroxymethyltransferase [Erysipelotrichaceae bacterium]